MLTILQLNINVLMVIKTDAVKVIIVNIMIHVKVYFMNKKNVFVLNYPGESIRQSDLLESDRIHVGIRLDLMEISIKPTKSWNNPGCGPTFGTLVPD